MYTKFKDVIDAPFKSNFGLKRGFLEERLGVSFFLIAVPLAGVLFVTIAALEYIKPWYTEYSVDQYDYFPSMAARAWPPYFSGLVIGSLQLPTVLLLGKALGCSSPYERVAAYIYKKTGICKSDYVMKLTQRKFDNLWGLFLLGGMVLGASFSSLYSGSFHEAQSLPFVPSFLGGFVT